MKEYLKPTAKIADIASSSLIAACIGDPPGDPDSGWRIIDEQHPDDETTIIAWNHDKS